MKKCNKLINLVILCIVFSFIYAIPSYARQVEGTQAGSGDVVSESTTEVQEHSAGEIIQEGDNFIEIGENQEAKIEQSSLRALSNTVYNILLVVGIIIAAILGGFLGIKFMMGSVDEQAEVKTMLVPYIAGCVVIFGAFTIWKIVLLIIQA